MRTLAHNEGIKELRHLSSLYFAIFHIDGFEERLIEELSRLWLGFEIRGVTVADQFDREFKNTLRQIGLRGEDFIRSSQSMISADTRVCSALRIPSETASG